MARTTAGQKDGTSIDPPKSGWNCSATGKPRAASIATRPCFTSTSAIHGWAGKHSDLRAQHAEALPEAGTFRSNLPDTSRRSWPNGRCGVG
eukprot:scaffold106448_cov31-Tisochrysis_lutea.AAC.1